MFNKLDQSIWTIIFLCKDRKLFSDKSKKCDLYASSRLDVNIRIRLYLVKHGIFLSLDEDLIKFCVPSQLHAGLL